MAITLQERFGVQAPVEVVWQFLTDPHRVVACVPGAQLEQIVDGRTFLGNIKVKVGPIAISYKGRVQFTEVDEAAHLVCLVADGRETGGGTARGSMSSSLQATADGYTQVGVDASVDVAGRIVQMGRGLLQDVASELFRQFADCVKEQLESTTPAPVADTTGAAAEPIRIVPLVLRALWSAILRIFRRLLGRPTSR